MFRLGEAGKKNVAVSHIFMDETVSELASLQPAVDTFDAAESFRAKLSFHAQRYPGFTHQPVYRQFQCRRVGYQDVVPLVTQPFLQTGAENKALALFLRDGARQFDQHVDVAAALIVVGSGTEHYDAGLAAE